MPVEEVRRMERLTIPDVRVDEHTTRRTMIDARAVKKSAMDFYWRLKAYEDTGLTPDEIKSMQGEHFSGLEMAKLHSALMELKKYQEADKDGRLVVLPCKVGDTVYFALLGRIIEKQVFSIVSFSNSTRIYCDGTSEYFRPEDIGKTFFLTREAADRALEAKKDEQSRTYQHPPEVV